MLKLIKNLVIVLIAVCAVTSNANAQVIKLSYNIVTIGDNTSDNYNMSAILAPDQLTVHQKDGSQLTLDFAAKTNYRVYHEQQSYFENSLIPMVAGLVEKKETSPSNRIYQVTPNHSTGFVSISFDGKTFVEYKPASIRLKPELSGLMRKFLLYNFQLDHKVLNLIDPNTIVEDMLFKIGDTTYYIKLDNIDTLKSHSPLPNGYSKTNLGDVNLYNTLSKVPNRLPDIEIFKSSMRAKLSQENYLGASLDYYHAYLLFSKDQMAEFNDIARQIFAKAPTGSGVVQLTKSLYEESDNEDEKLKVIQFLETFKKTNQLEVKILNIRLAQLYAQIGEIDKAHDLYLSTLSSYPYLTRVLREVGDIYFQFDDKNTAWAVWNTGKSLNPTHEDWQAIDQFEKELQQQAPEYF